MSYPKWLKPHLKYFYHLTEIDLMSRCLYGEAAGESYKGKLGIACVIRNRVLTPGWWGNSYKRVILAPMQFSCFNNDAPTLPAMRDKKESKTWGDCQRAALAVIEDNTPDIVGGATHYFNPSVCRIPPWAERMVKTCVIGAHHFYDELGTA